MDEPRSWKLECLVRGEKCGNAKRYSTREAALEAADSLFMRWMALDKCPEVVPSDDEPNDK